MNGTGVIVGKRRRALLGELRGLRTPIALYAPAGYGKTTFAALLRETMPACVHEQRGLRTAARDATVTADGLAFDEEEVRIALLPAEVRARDRVIDRIVGLTHGWPIAVLYMRRLALLGRLTRALDDTADRSYEDLYEYIDENVYQPASRSQRLALLLGRDGFFAHPLVRAAMQARRPVELASVSMRTERRPHRWLRTCADRLQQIGAPAFAAEATEMVREFEERHDDTARTHALQWLAMAHALSGNVEAALATCDRAGLGDLARWLRDPRGYAEELPGTAIEPRIAALFQEQHANRAIGEAAVRTAAPLRVELFRGTVLLQGRELPLTQREAAVLFMLASVPQRRMEARRLASTLWPEPSAEQARAALKVTIARLRVRLGNSAFVRSERGEYVLDREVEVDVAEARRALEAFERGGDYGALEAFHPVLEMFRPPRLRDAPWFSPIESALTTLAARLADHLAREATARGDARALRRIGTALLRADGCSEDGCALLLRSYLMEERAAEAHHAYADFARRLRAELGCDPSFTLESIGAGRP